MRTEQYIQNLGLHQQTQASCVVALTAGRHLRGSPGCCSRRSDINICSSKALGSPRSVGARTSYLASARANDWGENGQADGVRQETSKSKLSATPQPRWFLRGCINIRWGKIIVGWQAVETICPLPAEPTVPESRILHRGCQEREKGSGERVSPLFFPTQRQVTSILSPPLLWICSPLFVSVNLPSPTFICRNFSLVFPPPFYSSNPPPSLLLSAFSSAARCFYYLQQSSGFWVRHLFSWCCLFGPGRFQKPLKAIC